MRKSILMVAIGFIAGAVFTTASSIFAGQMKMVGQKVTDEYAVKINDKKLAEKAIVVNGSAHLSIRSVSNAIGGELRVKNKEIVLNTVDDDKEIQDKIADNTAADKKEEGKLPDNYASEEKKWINNKIKESLESSLSFAKKSLEENEKARERVIQDLETQKKLVENAKERCKSFPSINSDERLVDVEKGLREYEERLQKYDDYIARDKQSIAKYERELADHIAKMSNQQ